MVLSVLMYNFETWTLKQTQENRLRVFEMSCLRRFEGITCRDRIRNKEVCDRVGLLQDVANRIQQRRIAVAVCDLLRRRMVMCKEWIIPDIRNWHSTDMCMRQEGKKDPRRDGLTW